MLMLNALICRQVDRCWLVRRAEALAHLSKQRDQPVGADPLVLGVGHQIAAGQQLHAKEQAPVLELAKVVNLDDLLGADTTGGAGLVAEHRRHAVLLAEVEAKDLHRHPTPQ